MDWNLAFTILCIALICGVIAWIVAAVKTIHEDRKRWDEEDKQRKKWDDDYYG